ncbi:hypothetical protein [Chimaeribacter coloradensis]|nr:hypothetical protein [Chimaeribacter coloradensis]
MKLSLTLTSGQTTRTPAPAKPATRFAWLHRVLHALGQDFVGAGKRMY